MGKLSHFLIGIIVIFIVYCLIALFFTVFQLKFIFPGTSIKKDVEFIFDGKYEEFNVSTEDAVVLNALHFKSDIPTRGLVIYFHGNRRNLNDYGNYASDFTKHGYDVVFYDYRGYGKSGGKTNGNNLINDAYCLIDYVIARKEDLPLYLYGRSLGSGIAAHLAANCKIDKLLLDSPYADFNEVVARKFWFIPSPFLKKFNLSPRVDLKDINIPVSIIHGSRDKVVNISQSLQLEKINPAFIKRTVLNKSGHNNLRKNEKYVEWLANELN